jgi:hypothetical protein
MSLGKTFPIELWTRTARITSLLERFVSPLNVLAFAAAENQISGSSATSNLYDLLW